MFKTAKQDERRQAVTNQQKKIEERLFSDFGMRSEKNRVRKKMFCSLQKANAGGWGAMW